MVVPGCQPLVDGGLQLGDAVKSSSADHALGDQSEPAFHLIEPRATGGDEMDVESKTFFRFEPALHLRALVGAVVVHDEVNLQIRRHFLFHLVQEMDKLPAAMAGQATPTPLQVNGTFSSSEQRMRR